MKTYDIIVIGAGRGSNLARNAGKAGKKVAIIEKSKFGGTCPNRGCVPSKLLIGYAQVARGVKDSSRHFIDATINSIDVKKIFEDTNSYIQTIDPAYRSRFNENVDTYTGTASFVSNYVVQVNGEQITAPKIVIATGTRPINAPHEKAWTSDDIFPLLGEIPKSITIVGSGFIACELANFFDAVGIETKLLVRSQSLLKNEDEDISAIFKKEFTQHVDVVFDTSIKQIEHKDNTFYLTLENKSGTVTSHASEALLYATGRMANTDTLNLENTDIQTNEREFIVRDEHFETAVPGIYVVGDASGEHMLQHAAAAEVNHVQKALLTGKKEILKFKYMPHAVFTHPEIASVGLTEQDAKAKGIEYVGITKGWNASAKAQSMRLKYPRTKFLINPKTYEILGCHLIGPQSATMMHQVLSIMHIDNDIRHLKEMLYIHPALSEALLPAAVKAVGAMK
ncbi:FAD-dependent oxidoreductase [Sulfurimonas sp.]|jgi:mycothione reductase|uniref:dihydrolipoyl dehydrogenase family protein n=1 Tax=Sulfurimonas sp. TaxID=2022749 RepID=UPI0025D9E275|nr:FAD-dependent oxidoreductase [Sulfurimonas sp.]MBT5934452.1 FAD-dependent oxidoreductase [Sulfurimonas sp.]